MNKIYATLALLVVCSGFLVLYNSLHKELQPQVKQVQVVEPVVEQYKLCDPKFKLGDIVYDVQTGWKGQIGIIHPYADTRNDTCFYTVIVYDVEGGQSEDQYWEFQLRK